MEREVTTKNLSILRSYPEQKSRVSIWATSYSLSEKDVIVQFKAFDIATGKPVDGFCADRLDTKLRSNAATELTSFWIPNAETTVVAAYLHCADKGHLLARMVSWPDPLKFLKFSEDPNISVVVDEGGNQIFVKANAPVKGLVLAVADEDNGEDADWQDNGIDLVPQETVTVGVTELKGRSIAVRWLCDWETESKAEVLVLAN